MAEHNGNDAEKIRELARKIAYYIASRPYIIINMDLDGSLSFFSSKIFSPEVKIAGYSDSATQFIKRNGIKNENCLCFDIYCTLKNLACIDNHIIETLNHIIDDVCKCNPNLSRGVTFENYRNKYPFSTFIFLCAIYDKIGWAGFDLDAVVCHYQGNPVYLWELILRADDTLLTSRSRYIENAENWWAWLLEISGKNGMLYKIYQKVMQFSGNEALYEKIYINNVLKKCFFTQTEDGFNVLCENYHKFNNAIANAFGIKYTYPNPKNLTRHTFVKIVFESDNKELLEKIISSKYVFSYAFVTSRSLSVSIPESKIDNFTGIKCNKNFDRPLEDADLEKLTKYVLKTVKY